MKLLKHTGIAFFSLALTVVSSAQTTPAAPLIAKKAPSFARWTETTKIESAKDVVGENAQQGGGSDYREKGVQYRKVTQVTKTGDIRRVTTTESDGDKSVVWCKGELQVIFRREWPRPLLSTGENKLDAARLDFSEGDFVGFEWISAKNFTGIQQVGGRDCLVFRDSIRIGESSAGEQRVGGKTLPPKKVKAIACTDFETRLPVALQRGDEVITYKFGDRPGAMLSLPGQAEAVIDAWKIEKQQANRKPVRP